jgi:hypothetical protein
MMAGNPRKWSLKTPKGKFAIQKQMNDFARESRAKSGIDTEDRGES